jgi:hypothetical protein
MSQRMHYVYIGLLVMIVIALINISGRLNSLYNDSRTAEVRCFRSAVVGSKYTSALEMDINFHVAMKIQIAEEALERGYKEASFLGIDKHLHTFVEDSSFAADFNEIIDSGWRRVFYQNGDYVCFAR